MIEFTLIDGDGHVVSRGSAADEEGAAIMAEDGQTVVLDRAPERTKRSGDEWIPLDADEGFNLDFERRQARKVVDRLIAGTRRRYITTIPGQEMIYGAKEAEAKAYIAAGSPADLTDYPLLAAEVGVTAETADQLAQLWLNMAALWREVASALEPVRLSTSAAIAAAETKVDIDAALADLTAQLDAL